MLERNVKIIAHKAPAARLKRLRVAWFALGGTCGLAIGVSLGSLLASSHSNNTPAIAAPAEKVTPHAALPPALSALKPAAGTPTPPSKALNFPASVSLRMDQGDTLLSVLTDTGISDEEAHAAVTAIRKVFDPRRLDAGTQLAVTLGPSGENPRKPTINRLSLPISKTAVLELKKAGSGNFDAQTLQAPTEKKLALVGGPIKNSFYVTAQQAGVPPEAIAELMKAYSYDVDFQRDIQRGDTLQVLLERTQTKNGTVTGYGDVRYAALTFKHKTIAVFRYTDKSGHTDYYTAKGESLRKALLRTPINGAHITSAFGMRIHPLLGYSKMHRGVDFGAAEGTPIYAAGDGVVEVAGPFSSYGNYVRIRHNPKYETAYAHASRIASGIHPGMRVRQGQVIAYVGATGRATGPHLHYEVMMSGTQVNPAGIKFKTGNILTGRELAAFKTRVRDINVTIASLSTRQVASAK